MTQRATPTILATAAVILPAAGVWIIAHPSGTIASSSTPARATATPASHKTAAHKAPAKTTTYKYTGPSADMEWGPVQVTIVVKGKHITDVQATAPTERARSAFINQQAVPMLRQEVLQAQSASINAIGGATMTSDAFYQSLLPALQAAHRAHTL